jgi:acylphosphatase
MSENNTVQKHLVIQGRVQGVGFRYFTQKNADDLDLTGWVKNLPDGSVETVISGKPDCVDEMLRRLQKGPVSARVDNVKEIRSGKERESFRDFSIRR